MTTTTSNVLYAGVCVAILLVPSRATAQSTDDGAVFDFSLPGARARGMGGAFVAIADDASAIYSNPAGLTDLFRPEVSLEGRLWNVRQQVIDRGHAFGSPTGIGIDTVEGVHDREFSETFASPAFMSAVYPRGRWAAGVFYHQLVRYEMKQQTQGPLFNCRGGGRGPTGRPPFCEQGDQGDGIDRHFPATLDYKVGITGVGGGFAYEVTDAFKAGVSVQVYNFDITRISFVYAARGDLKYAPPNMSPQNLEIASYRIGKDQKVGVNAGVLWNLSGGISVGGTFRQGQTFHYLSQNISGPANPPGGTMFTNNPETPFRVPDTWAAGFAYKPSNDWRIGFEYDRVQYEQVMDNFINTSLPDPWPETRVLQESVRIDNSDQFRFGGEYQLSTPRWQWAFRAGLWTDPFHQPYLDVTDPDSGLPAPGWALYLPKRDGQTHFSGGVGIATQRHVQVDFAVDHAKSITIVSLSAIYRF